MTSHFCRNLDCTDFHRCRACGVAHLPSRFAQGRWGRNAVCRTCVPAVAVEIRPDVWRVSCHGETVLLDADDLRVLSRVALGRVLFVGQANNLQLVTLGFYIAVIRAGLSPEKYEPVVIHIDKNYNNYCRTNLLPRLRSKEVGFTLDGETYTPHAAIRGVFCAQADPTKPSKYAVSFQICAPNGDRQRIQWPASHSKDAKAVVFYMGILFDVKWENATARPVGFLDVADYQPNFLFSQLIKLTRVCLPKTGILEELLSTKPSVRKGHALLQQYLQSKGILTIADLYSLDALD